MNELLFLPIFFFLLLYKYKKNTLAIPLIIYYFIGSLLAFAMTKHPLFESSLNAGIQNPSFGATIFLIVCLYMLFYPVLKQSGNTNLNLRINDRWFYRLSAVFIFISIIYIVIIAPHIFDALNSLDFIAYKENVMEEGLNLTNSVTLGWMLTYQVAIRPILVFLFCLSLATKKKKMLVLLLGIVAFLPPILNSLASAHRNIMVFSAIDCLLCFLILKNHFTKKTKRVFYIVGTSFICLTIFIVVYFALLRFSYGGNDFFIYTMERYMGEPFVNFNTMLWGEDNYLWGNKSFTVIRKYLGMSYIDPAEIQEYSYNMQYVPYFFYSIVGNFYMDFGPIGCILLCFLICCIFKQLFRKEALKNNASFFLYTYLYISVMVKSYYYFIYQGYNFLSLIFLIISAYLMHKLIFVPNYFKTTKLQQAQ